MAAVMQVRIMDMTAMNTVLIIQRMAAGAMGPTEMCIRDRQLLLGGHAAADQDQLRVEDRHHACKPLRDLVRPCVQQRQHGLVARFCGGKDGAAVLPCRRCV